MPTDLPSYFIFRTLSDRTLQLVDVLRQRPRVVDERDDLVEAQRYVEDNYLYDSNDGEVYTIVKPDGTVLLSLRVENVKRLVRA